MTVEADPPPRGGRTGLDDLPAPGIDPIDPPRWSRILLKLSGEALMGEQHFGIDVSVVDRIASDIAEARELSESTEWGPAAGGFRDLMTRWKAAGSAQRDVDDRLWAEFRGLQDAFFAARTTVQSAQDAEFSGNLTAKEELLTQAEADLLPDVLHTSVLRRAITTSQLALDACDRLWVPVRRSWRLNERHYGALQGKDKKQTLAEYGEDQFMIWRRSFDTPPPPIDHDDEYAQTNDPRYSSLPPELVPATECLADVIDRMLPYWYDAIVPDLLAGQTVLVTAHGNSLRALVKHLDDISDADIAGLNIPTGIPLVYELDSQLKPVTRGGRYLDPTAAAEAAEAVANQGR